MIKTNSPGAGTCGSCNPCRAWLQPSDTDFDLYAGPLTIIAGIWTCEGGVLTCSPQENDQASVCINRTFSERGYYIAVRIHCDDAATIAVRFSESTVETETTYYIAHLEITATAALLTLIQHAAGNDTTIQGPFPTEPMDGWYDLYICHSQEHVVVANISKRATYATYPPWEPDLSHRLAVKDGIFLPSPSTVGQTVSITVANAEAPVQFDDLEIGDVAVDAGGNEDTVCRTCHCLHRFFTADDSDTYWTSDGFTRDGAEWLTASAGALLTLNRVYRQPAHIYSFWRYTITNGASRFVIRIRFWETSDDDFWAADFDCVDPVTYDGEIRIYSVAGGNETLISTTAIATNMANGGIEFWTLPTGAYVGFWQYDPINGYWTQFGGIWSDLAPPTGGTHVSFGPTVLTTGNLRVLQLIDLCGRMVVAPPTDQWSTGEFIRSISAPNRESTHCSHRSLFKHINNKVLACNCGSVDLYACDAQNDVVTIENIQQEAAETIAQLEPSYHGRTCAACTSHTLLDNP